MFHCVFYYFHHCKSIKKIFILAKTWTCSEETKAFKPQLQWCHQDPPKRWVKRCVCVGERGRGRDTNWAKSTCRNLIIPSHTVCRGRRLGWAHRWMCFYSKVHKVLLTTLLTVVVVVCRRTTTMQWQMKLTQRQRWEPGVVSPQIFCFNVKTYYYFFFLLFLMTDLSVIIRGLVWWELSNMSIPSSQHHRYSHFSKSIQCFLQTNN